MLEEIFVGVQYDWFEGGELVDVLFL